MSRLRSIMLTTGAVVGSLCLLVAIAGLLFGIKPLIFKSGSMSPTIPAGALAFSRPVDAPDVKVGDIVSTFTSNTTGHVRVTHRVYAVSGSGASRSLTLKGDANPTPDAQPYTVTRVDRVFWSVPWVGHVVVFVGSPIGLMLLGALAVLVLYVGFRRPRGGGGAHSGPVSGGGSGGKRRALAAVAPMAALVLAAPATIGTWAAFTDTAQAYSGTFTATTVVRPDSVSCGASGADVTFSWPEKDPRYDYEITLYREGSPNVLVSTNEVNGAAVSRQYNASNDFGLSGSLLGTSGTYTFFAQVRSWLSATSISNRWQSPDTTTSTQRVQISVSCTIILLCSVGNPACVT